MSAIAKNMSEVFRFASACAKIIGRQTSSTEAVGMVRKILQDLIDANNREYADANVVPDDWQQLLQAEGDETRCLFSPYLDKFGSRDRVVWVPKCSKVIHIGDVHGDMSSLRNILMRDRDLFTKEDVTLVFHGDVIDAKLPEQYQEQLEVIFCLVALRLIFPKRVIWLRGNHEDYHVKYLYAEFTGDDRTVRKFVTPHGGFNFGFHAGVHQDIYMMFGKIFDQLPIMALLYNQDLKELTFAAHGSIPGHSSLRLSHILQHREKTLWGEMEIGRSLPSDWPRDIASDFLFEIRGMNLISRSSGQVGKIRCITGHSHQNRLKTMDNGRIELCSLSSFSIEDENPMFFSHGVGLSSGSMLEIPSPSALEASAASLGLRRQYSDEDEFSVASAVSRERSSSLQRCGRFELLPDVGCGGDDEEDEVEEEDISSDDTISSSYSGGEGGSASERADVAAEVPRAF